MSIWLRSRRVRRHPVSDPRGRAGAHGKTRRKFDWDIETLTVRRTSCVKLRNENDAPDETI
jgi:hypothetical protein